MLIHGIGANEVHSGFVIRGDDGDYISSNNRWIKLKSPTCTYIETEVKNRYLLHVEFSTDQVYTERLEFHTEEEDEDEQEFNITTKQRGRPKKEKRNTREPTEYNRFIQAAMESVKQLFPYLPGKERFKLCVEKWKQRAT